MGATGKALYVLQMLQRALDMARSGRYSVHVHLFITSADDIAVFSTEVRLCPLLCTACSTATCTSVCVCLYACVCVCRRACVPACLCACVCARVRYGCVVARTTVCTVPGLRIPRARRQRRRLRPAAGPRPGSAVARVCQRHRPSSLLLPLVPSHCAGAAAHSRAGVRVARPLNAAATRVGVRRHRVL